MQIAEARDNLILRKCVQQWREKTAENKDLYGRVTLLSNKRCLRAFFNKWRARTREKQHVLIFLDSGFSLGRQGFSA